MDRVHKRARLLAAAAAAPIPMTAPTGVPYPTSIQEVKRQMAAAKAKVNAAAEEEKQRKQAERQAGDKESAPDTDKMDLPETSPSSLLAIRLHRDSLLESHRLLEHKLSLITWVEFRRQSHAIEFMRQQLRSAREEAAATGEEEPHPSTLLRLFSYELGLRSHSGAPTGARRFIVTTYEDMWTRYFTFHASNRHHYEMILEGHPCHLYFDIEFKWAANPQFRRLPSCALADSPAADSDSDVDLIDVEDVMRALCHEIVSELNRLFHFEPPVTNHQILQLDSSSNKKFSRHLLIRLDQDTRKNDATSSSPSPSPSPNPPTSLPPTRFMFRDNAHAGRFVRSLCQTINNKVHSESTPDTIEDEEEAKLSTEEIITRRRQLRHRKLLRYIIVNDGDAASSHDDATAALNRPNTTMMIDQSVYTRNRSFRLFLSSKNVPPSLSTSPGDFDLPPTLLVAEENDFPLAGIDLKTIFMSTLICNIACPLSELRLITFSETEQAEILAPGAINAPEFEADDRQSNEHQLERVRRDINQNGKRARDTVPSSSSYASSGRRFHSGPSPFPRLESFCMQNLPGRDTITSGPEPRISGWAYFKETDERVPSSASAAGVLRHSVTFNFSSYRYCGNIGRAHRSNGVYFVLDLLSRTLDQRCWDHDCRYYRSQPIAIPHWMVDMELSDLARTDEEEEQEEQALQRANDAAAQTKMTPTSTSKVPTPPPARSLFDDDGDAGDVLDFAAFDRLESAALASSAGRSNSK